MRSQGRLLVGAVALVGLVVAGPGCDSLPYRIDGPNPAPAPAPVAMGQPMAPPQSTTFPIFRTAQRPRPMAAPGGGAASAVALMRPVPHGGDASVWAPVQRTQGELPVISTSRDAVAQLDRPQPISSPAEGARLLPMPTPLSGGAVAVGPPPRKPAAPPSEAERRATGYPELPPLTITSPLDAPREGAKRALSAYVIEPPDVLVISGGGKLINSPENFRGSHLVRPDGSIGFYTYPSIFVAGLTIDQAKVAVARSIEANRRKVEKDDKPLTFDEILGDLQVDVANYNSKFVYVLADGGGYGEQVFRLPFTGNETVLDAIAQIQGLPAVASKARIWVARATLSGPPNILPVDYCAVTQGGLAPTNYQLYPSDRVYIHSDPKIRLDSRLAKFLAPIERLFGITLLSSSAINSIRTGSNFNNTGIR